MELLYPVSIAIFFVIIFSIFPKLRSKTKSHKKLPPGPTKLPIIGNLHNIMGALPHRSLRQLSRKYGPLMHLKLGELSTFVVSSAELAREVMRTNDISFAQRPKLLVMDVGYGHCDIAFAPYGEYWRQMKKLCVIELLSNKRVQSFSSIREEEVQSLVRSILSSSTSPINLTDRLLELTSTITCRAAFGRNYDSEDATTLLSNTKEATLLVGGFELADLYPSIKILRILSPSLAKIRKLFRGIDLALQNIINKHVSETRVTEEIYDGVTEVEDLIDVLLRLQKSGGLEVPITTDCIKAIIADMFSGGTDTAATTMEWAMAEMIKQPRVMAKAQAEIRQNRKGKKIINEADIQVLSYLKLVVKETLRLHPPLPLLLPRECREACVIEGYEIPIKTKVLINAWAIGRDPKYWDSAETFYPERFMNACIDHKGTNFEYIPFGAGRRICPGMTFGLANVELALSQLLFHFDWNLPDGMRPENLDMTELFGGTVGRKFDLRLMAVPFLPVEE